MVGTLGAPNYTKKCMDANVQVQTWTYRLSKPKMYPNAQRHLNEWKQKQKDYCSQAEADKMTVMDSGGPEAQGSYVEKSGGPATPWVWLAGGAAALVGAYFLVKG